MEEPKENNEEEELEVGPSEEQETNDREGGQVECPKCLNTKIQLIRIQGSDTEVVLELVCFVCGHLIINSIPFE